MLASTERVCIQASTPVIVDCNLTFTAKVLQTTLVYKMCLFEFAPKYELHVTYRASFGESVF